MIIRSIRDSNAREAAFWIAVVLVFAGGLAIRVHGFTEPWAGVHMAWGGAFYGNVARNLVRYGYLATGLAPIVSTGVVDPSHFQLYYHHPLLSMLVTSVSFHAFGVHEWSARLAPLIFSLMTMGLVFQFAREEFGRITALVALIFFALIPVEAYYATHLDPYGSMSIFFTALAVDSYRRWVVSRSNVHYALCAASIGLGCFTGWFTFMVIPGIVAHGLFVLDKRWRRDAWLRLLLLPALSVVVFGIFMLHRKLLFASGLTEIFDSLGDRLQKRTADMELSRLGIARTHIDHIWTLYTPAFVAMTAAWVILFIRDVAVRQARLADWCIAILLSFGVLYGLTFPGHLPSHDYFVRPYAPGTALASAVLLSRVAQSFRSSLMRTVTVVAVVAVTAVFSLQALNWLFSIEGHPGVAMTGYSEAVAAVSTPQEPVFTPLPDDRVLSYYLDRPMTYDVNTPARLEAAIASAEADYLIAVPEAKASRFPEILAYLQKRYPEQRDKGLIIFEGGKDRIQGKD